MEERERAALCCGVHDSSDRERRQAVHRPSCDRHRGEHVSEEAEVHAGYDQRRDNERDKDVREIEKEGEYGIVVEPLGGTPFRVFVTTELEYKPKPMGIDW